MNKMRFIDLFAGMGGLRLGFEEGMKEIGIETKCVLTSEIKPYAITTLEENFEHEKFVGDITKVDEKTIPDFDVLLGGFPCQAFSFAGHRKGFSDTRGTLFFEIERILKEKRPKYFILENVEGIIKHDYESGSKKPIGRTFEVILNNLERLGYYVDWKLIDSSDFGVPQKRKRVFIIGSLEYPVFLTDFKKETKYLKDILITGMPTISTEFTKKILQFYKVEELYGKKINDKRGGDNNIHSWDFDLKGKTSSKQKRLTSDLLKFRRQKKWAEIIGIKWMDGMPLTAAQIYTFAHYYKNEKELERDLNDLVKKGYLAFEHPRDIELIDNISKRTPRLDLEKGYNIVSGKLSFEFNQILSPTGIAPTLVATDVSRLGVIDNGNIRPISIEESLSLFGYPETYKMPKNKTLAYDLLGNTVVVPVVKEVSKKLLIDNKKNHREI